MEEKSSRCFNVLTGSVFELDPSGQKQADESDLRRGAFRLFRRKSAVRGKRLVVHRVRLDYPRASAGVTLLWNRNENIAMVRKRDLSQDDDILLATVTTMESEGEGAIGRVLRGARGNALYRF